MNRQTAPLAAAFAALALLGQPLTATAQPGPQLTPTQMIAAQQKALAPLAALDGVWRGEGQARNDVNEPLRKLVYQARVGQALDGTIRILEVQGRLADGETFFHSFNNLAYDAQKSAYVMTARAGGRSGDFKFAPTADGYVWEIGGGGRGIRYTGVLKAGVWTERGESIAPDRPPITLSEITLTRIGDSRWPEDGGLPAK